MAANWKPRVIELESIIEDCQKFLDLVPLQAMEKGLTWYPSDAAVQLGLRAKNSIAAYAAAHIH